MRPIAVAVLLTAALGAAGHSSAPCKPGDCGVGPSHMEMLSMAYAEVDPNVDVVVLGKVDAVQSIPRPEGSDLPELEELHASQLIAMHVAVDEPVAGCVETGDRLLVVVSGYGGWQWQERTQAEMAPVLAVAQAVQELDSEVRGGQLEFHGRDMLGRLKRNRRRLIELSAEQGLPFLWITVGPTLWSRRSREAILLPGQRYLMLVPGGGEQIASGPDSSGLGLEIFPASFAEHLPEAAPPDDCEATKRRREADQGRMVARWLLREG